MYLPSEIVDVIVSECDEITVYSLSLTCKSNRVYCSRVDHHFLFASAARYNSIALLILCRESGCIWDERVCTVAAANGHLDTLKWLRSNWFPWDACTSSAASANGHLDVLKWCVENDCDCDVNSFIRLSSSEEVVQWLMSELSIPRHSIRRNLIN